MKKFFSVETTENLINAELGIVPTQNATAMDAVLFAQVDPVAGSEINPGAVNVVLDENAVVEDGFIIIDGVAIPTEIAEGEVEEIEPEAPPVPLSGGGSGEPFELGDIGPNIGISDLLPPTALLFTIPEEEELDPFVDPNDTPDVDVIPDDPIDPNLSDPSITPIDAVVVEPALPGGSDAGSGGDVTTGDLIVDTGNDELASLVINGVDVTNGGTVDGTYGTLDVTANPDGTFDYTYVLTDNTIDHPDAGSVGTTEGISDDFTVVVTDDDGDIATDTLVVGIVDDGPVAVVDTATQDQEDAPVTVDLFANDSEGADGVNIDSGLDIVPGSLSGNGTLVDNGDGTVTYTPAPGEDGDITFEYIITDGDGDTSTAVGTITLLEDSEPTLTINPEASVVDESALDADGSNPSSDAETTSGDLTIDTGNDTLDTLVIDGVDVTSGGTVTGTYGVLTVTETNGAYTWSYELTDSTADHANGDVADNFAVVATDSDGDSASDSLVVNIVDDVPTAIDDSAAQMGENTPVTVDVFANDVEGADGVNADTGVAEVPNTLSGTGSLVDNGDGTFTYTPGPGENGTVTFDYEITDADGDTSIATATITLEADSEPVLESDSGSVDESALVSGSNPASPDEIETGGFFIDTGNDTVGSLVIDGVDVTTGGTVNGTYGILTVTETNGTYTYSYELTDNTTDHSNGAVVEDFSVEVTDSDGDTVSDTLTIDVIDDAPAAENDSNTATEGGPDATGNVLDNDAIGADDGVVGTDSVVSLDSPAVGTFGTLTLNADGTYSYTPNASVPAGSMDSFDYTLTDADGDTATATLIITFEGDNNAPTATPDSSILSDVSGDDNTDGSNADAFVPVSDTGDLGFDFGLDGPNATNSFDTSYDGGLGAATTSSTAGETTIAADDGSWTLVIDEATGEYTFTQNTAYAHDSGVDTDAGIVSVTITDSDGSPVSVDINLTINDDVPTATDDADTATEGGPAVTGDVLVNDDIGADHGTVGTDSVVSLDSPAVGTFGTLTLNADGTYSYTPNASVPAGSMDRFDYTVTDADGDTATATLTITFEGDNNAPTATPDASVLSDVSGDDSLDGSNADAFVPSSDTGDLGIDFGLDGAGTFGTVYDGGLGAATTSSAAGETTITADDGSWTLVIDETSGEYSFTQNTVYDHDLGADTDTGVVTVTITDSDGSAVSVDIDLTINDDVPIANDDSLTAQESLPAYQGNVLINDDIGADHGTVGTDSFVTLISPSAGTFGNLTLNADGSYIFDPLVSVPAGSIDIYEYMVTDADGDTSTATLTITFEGDNNTPFATSDSSTLSDISGDDNTDGSNADAFVPVSDTGDLGFNFGADGAGTFGTSYDDGLGTATTSSVAGTTTISADDGSWTLEIDETTGEYTFTQNTSYDHDLGADTDTGVVTVTITDSDGSPISVDINLAINDDVPTATNDADTATEGGPAVTGDVLVNDDIGADHGTVGTDSVVSLDSPAVGTFGTLTLNADGTYSYTPNASVPAGSMDSFDYTVTDADGDTATATLTITFEGDNNAPTAGATTALADEDDLADGIGDTASGDDDPADLTGTLTHDYGLDGSGSITLLDGAQTVNGVDYTYTVGTDINGDQVITANDGSQDVFTLTLTDAVAGTYEVELLAAVDHLGSDPAFEDNLLFNLGYRVEDSDGSTADGTFAFTVDDDVPVEVENEIPFVHVDEDELPGGITDNDFSTTVDTGDVSNLVNFGADQPGEFGLGSDTSGLPALTSAGVAITYAVANDVLTASAGTTDVFTLDMNADGTFTFTLLAQIDHPNADGNDNENLNIDFASIITATDSDGDVITLTQGVFVGIEDDVPTADPDSNVVAEGAILNAGVLDGVLANDQEGADTASIAGVRASGGDTTTDILTGVGADIAGLYGTLTLNADGSYTYESNPNSIATDSADVFVYTLIDGDGDTVTTTLTINVLNGGLAAPTDTIQVDEAAIDTSIEGDDIAVGTVTGSLGTASGDETATDALAATGGTGPYTYTIVGSSTGTYGTIQINPDGTYTYTLTSPVDTTPDSNGPNTELAADSFTYEVEDANGNTETGTINVNIVDDAPVATLELEAGASLVIDESLGENSGEFEGGASGLGQVTITAGDLFSDTSVFGADGAAAVNGTVYSLNVTSSADTGLVDVATGQAITLVDNAGVIEGQNANGDVVFTIEVAANGDMTVTQLRALEHDDDMDPDEATSPEVLGAGFVELEVQVTDGDGDIDTASVDLGDVISFEDDGPDIDASVTDGDTVLLTTQDAETIGAMTEDTDTSTADFGGAFTIVATSYGTDGAGTTVWAFELSVDNAVSGLSSDGDAITLFLIGGEVIGSTAADAGSVTAGNTIFSIATNATSGEVTLTQFAEIDHDLPGDASNYDTQLEILADGLVSLDGTATITDRDGDTAFETLTLDLGGNIQFADDGPSVTATPTMATLVVDETVLATDATADLSGAFNVDFGADGAGTTIYTLDVSANAVDSGINDVATGEDVLLRINGSGEVEGYTSISDEVVFTVSVDANGVVELDQIRAIEHTPNTGPDQATGLTGTDLISLTANVTDGDGDTASDTIDLTGTLSFEDDAPTISSTPTMETLTVDETDLLIDATADLSGAFTSSFGADGAGDIKYGLSISVLDADTGLVDVQTGEAVLLRINGSGQVEGYSASGGPVFTVAVDANGNVELDQIRAVEHPDAMDDDESIGLTGSNLITLTARITDRDGDTETATIDLTGALAFEDDGPDSSTNGATLDTLVLDESPLPIDGDGIDSVTANFADNFTAIDYGSDGAGSTTYSLTLSANGIGSGLYALDAADVVDTDGDGIGQGAEIVLTLVGDVITGSAGGTDYFTITIDSASGEITFTQINNIWHGDTADADDVSALVADGAITLTQTVTDEDDDSASSSIELGSGVFSIEDDGPTLEVSASGAETMLDETDAGEDFVSGPIMVTSTDAVINLDTQDYGTDGPGSLTYALTGSGASGLATADGDLPITLVQTDATTITGTFNGGADTAFTVVINSDGTITVTQNVALEHNTDGDNMAGEHNDTLDLAGLITASATITDADGDSSTDSAQIGNQIVFYDDGPSIQFANNLNVNEDFATVDGLPGGPGDTNTIETDTDVAAISFGADGAGSLDVVVGVTGPSGAGNLPEVDITSNGLPVVFTWDASTNTGTGTTTDGATVETDIFTLSIDPATGEYTFEILQQIDHVYTDPDLLNNGPETAFEDLFSIQFIATITDADGDTASDSFFVTVNDDSPVVTGTAAIAPVLITDDTDIADSDMDDFSGLFSAVYGEDGPAASDELVYELSFSGATGVVDTLSGESVTLAINAAGTEIIGSTSVGGDEVFRITLDPDTGEITQSQSRAVEHDNAADPIETGAEATVLGSVITLTAIATDFDGDASTFDINIGSSFTFEDDGPSVTAIADTGEGVALDEGDTDAGAGATSTAAAINTGTIVIGDDPDVAGTGSISSGSSADALVDISAVDFGSDGPEGMDANAATSYELSVTDAVSGVTATDGSAINLVDINGDGSVIVGQVSGGAFDGQAAFAIEIASDTGIVTVEQYLSLDHPTEHDGTLAGSDYDETISLDAGSLSVIATVTDGDGDTASSAAINVGNQITFDDDGPFISFPPTGTATLIVDEDFIPGTGNMDSTMDAGDTAGGTIDFGTATINFGSDGAAADDLDIEITVFGTSGINGAPPITALSSGGVNLVYSFDDSTNTFTATAGNAGPTIFTLEIDTATGDFEFTLVGPMDHPLTDDLDAGNGVETSYEDLIGIFFNVTITDGDGDSASAEIRVNINDDSPTIDVDSNDTNSVVLETQDADTDPGTDVDTGDFSTVFSIASSAYGADGAGNISALSYVLSLAGANGTDSGLTSDGATINLFVDGGVIYGATTAVPADAAANAVFTVTVDGSGQVTLTQFEEIDHAAGGANPDYDSQVETLANGLINLTASATITDFDGDAISNSETIDLGGNLSFADDGPVANTVVASAQTDDEGTGDFAADSNTDNGSGDVAGAPNSVADATAGTLFDAGADGFSSIAFTAPNVMAIYEGASGLALQESLTFATVDNGGSFTYTATGAISGDTVFTLEVNAGGSYTFTQSAPLVHGTNEPEEIDDLAVQIGFTVTDGDGDTSASGSLTINVDDDTPESGTFADMVVGNYDNAVDNETNSDFSSGADGWQAITITGPVIDGISYDYSTDVVGGVPVTIATGYSTGGDPVNDAIFTFSVDGDGNTEFVLLEPEGSTTEIIQLAGVDSGNLPFVETADFRVEFSAQDATATPSVNSSTTGLGVSDQFIENGETLTMQFFEPGLSGDDPANATSGPGDATEDTSINAITFANTSSGGDVSVTVTNTVTGQTATATVTVTSGNQNNPGELIIDSTTIPGLTFGFNQIEITGLAGSNARLRSGEIERLVLPQDQEFVFDIDATDGDGDVVSATVGVTIDTTITSGPTASQIKYSAPETGEFDASPLAFALDTVVDDFGFDAGAARGSMNTGFNGMAVLLGGMAMAAEANAFENIFETLQPTLEASDFGHSANNFSAGDLNNAFELVFESVNNVNELMSEQDAAFDSSTSSDASPFSADDLDAADLLGSAFEGIEAGFEAVSPPNIGGTEIAAQSFDVEFGMPDIATNQFFLDTELDDLLAQMPEILAADAPVTEGIQAESGSEISISPDLVQFGGTLPNELIPNGIEQGHTLQGLEDFHILAMTNSIAVI